MFHDVVTVGNRGGEVEILLDEENGETLRLERADGVPDVLDDDRRHSSVGSSSSNKRAPVRRSADRQHLLLAAGEFRALTVEAFP